MPITFDPALDIGFHRFVPVPRQLMWRAWTEPEHLMKWFCPLPWKTTACEIDLRPGGAFSTVMEGPAGEKVDNAGCILDVVPHARLVWTDGLLPGYRPRDGGFMTGCVRFEEAEGGTRYHAMALHENPGDRNRHVAMGFEQGWGTALDQMVAMIRSQWM